MKKQIINIFFVNLLLIFLIILSYSNMVAYAEEVDSEITLTEITDQERLNTFFENTSIRVEEKEPVKSIIKGFDVNENGVIAILHPAMFNRYYIRIISCDGTFQKAFYYKTSGEVAIRWEGENLQIFNIRGGVVFTIDMDANILDVYDITWDQAWSEYYKNELQATEKTVGDTTYAVKNDLSKSIKCNLVVTSLDESKVIYDDNGLALIGSVVIISFVVILFTFVFIKACLSLKRK